MNAKDLRIGDIIYRPCCNDIVKQILENGIIGDDNIRGIISLESIKPIPITEELMKKLGFTEKYDDYFPWKEYELAIDKGFVKISNISNTVDKDWSVHIDNLDHESIGGMDIQYLHELQHLVWDSLHVELKIK